MSVERRDAGRGARWLTFLFGSLLGGLLGLVFAPWREWWRKSESPGRLCGGVMDLTEAPCHWDEDGYE